MFLTRNIQINHAELSTFINPFNQQLLKVMPQQNSQMLEVMDNLVNQQAAMISYNNDFKLMMIITLAAIPLTLLLRKPNHAPSNDEEGAMVME